MNGQYLNLMPSLPVDHAASQMNTVLSPAAFYQRMASLQHNIVYAEKRQVVFHNGLSHFHSGMAGLRIHSARMGHAHRKIHIPHNLGIYNGRNILYLYAFPRFPVGEFHPFQGWSLYITCLLYTSGNTLPVWNSIVLMKLLWI